MKRNIIVYILAFTMLLLSGCTQNNTTDTGTISEAEAQNIALEHAELSTDQVTFTKSSMDVDDGRKKYDIEFYTNDNKEYDYEIDGYSGNILEWNVEPIYK